MLLTYLENLNREYWLLLRRPEIKYAIFLYTDRSDLLIAEISCDSNSFSSNVIF